MVPAVNCGQLSAYPPLAIHLLKSPTVLLSAGAAEKRSSGNDQRQGSQRLGCETGCPRSGYITVWDEFLRKGERCE